MGIHEILVEKIINFEVETGSRPNAIYLGHNEIDALKAWWSLLGVKPIKATPDVEFWGIKVYEVKANNHLGVGNYT